MAKRINQDTILIFTYGLLKRKYHHQYQELNSLNLQFVDSVKSRGTLYDLGEYPGAYFERKTATYVHGELMQVDSMHALDILDEFEGLYDKTPEYERVLLPVTIDENEVICWAYQYLGPFDRPIIQSGNY